MVKRLISLVLVIAMLAGIFPAEVLAGEPNNSCERHGMLCSGYTDGK